MIGGDGNKCAIALPDNAHETAQFFKVVLTYQVGGMDSFVPAATIGLVCEP
jgi:hypothetical protein